jgi:membrane-associated phospholipid phosphatase
MVLLQIMQDSFWQKIKPFDSWLLSKINQTWSNDLLDYTIPFVRETLFWIPLYLFLFLFAVLNFGKKGAWWILGFLLTASLADIISSQFIKETIFRLRPCRDMELGGSLRFFINYCPGSSSFTSSHATSHFAQAMFFYLTLRNTSKWWSLAFVWAFIIAYGQVYVGVHYPFDVFCGALVGCLIGWFTGRMFRNRVGLLSLAK